MLETDTLSRLSFRNRLVFSPITEGVKGKFVYLLEDSSTRVKVGCKTQILFVESRIFGHHQVMDRGWNSGGSELLNFPFFDRKGTSYSKGSGLHGPSDHTDRTRPCDLNESSISDYLPEIQLIPGESL